MDTRSGDIYDHHTLKIFIFDNGIQSVCLRPGVAWLGTHYDLGVGR